MAFRKSTSASKRAAEIFSAAHSNTAGRIKAPGLLLRLFRGELPLIRTFWTFFLSIPLLGNLVFSYLVFPHLDVTSAVGTASIFLWGTLALLYMGIMSVGVWRSACRYAGPSSWAMLAKLAAVLGAAGGVAYALMWYSSWMILSNA